MKILENLEVGKRTLLSSGHFSGCYNQDLYLKKSVNDGSRLDKFYLSVFSNVDGMYTQQGYLYFYLDHKTKSSSFVGVKVETQFRNLNIGSFLVASWIDLCMNNGYDFLGTHPKQRKPFLLYLLKTYGFEIFDKSLYEKRSDVISICRSVEMEDKTKYLLFKDSKHEESFVGTNVYKYDNYKIIDGLDGFVCLDRVILPLQNMRKNYVSYELCEHNVAEEKVRLVLARHKA